MHYDLCSTCLKYVRLFYYDYSYIELGILFYKYVCISILYSCAVFIFIYTKCWSTIIFFFLFLFFASFQGACPIILRKFKYSFKENSFNDCSRSIKTLVCILSRFLTCFLSIIFSHTRVRQK